ncbi:MAG: TusE/DsrC/DsvC family sulfur relay protein [Alphaproteobacteria bacterium]
MRDANDIMKAILDPTGQDERDESFPNAPRGWSRKLASERSVADDLDLTEDHWEVIRVLQACFADEEEPPVLVWQCALDPFFLLRNHPGEQAAWRLR